MAYFGSSLIFPSIASCWTLAARSLMKSGVGFVFRPSNINSCRSECLILNISLCSTYLICRTSLKKENKKGPGKLLCNLLTLTLQPGLPATWLFKIYPAGSHNSVSPCCFRAYLWDMTGYFLWKEQYVLVFIDFHENYSTRYSLCQGISTEIFEEQKSGLREGQGRCWNLGPLFSLYFQGLSLT